MECRRTRRMSKRMIFSCVARTTVAGGSNRKFGSMTARESPRKWNFRLATEKKYGSNCHGECPPALIVVKKQKRESGLQRATATKRPPLASRSYVVSTRPLALQMLTRLQLL